MITVIGEALIDLVDQADGPVEGSGGRARPFVAHAGGSPMNVAIGVARLDRPAALCARLGTGAFGRMLRAHLEANRVDLSGSVTATEPTTLAVVSLDAEQKAGYDFYVEGTADFRWRPAELAQLPAGTTVLHTGSLASWLPPGDAVVADRVEAARAAGLLTSYDPNVRPGLMPADAVERIERTVARAHLVKVSDDDLAHLFPGEAVEAVTARWLDLGARLVVVTRGAGGADAFAPAALPVHRDGFRVDVVDTVGAGDAFTAGLLAGLDARGAATPAGLDALAADPAALADLLRHAMVVAAITCSRPGADPPTAAEVAGWSPPA